MPDLKNQHRSERRKGAATIELAVCIPVLLLLVLGALEACNVIFLKQMVTAAAYEAARAAALSDATQTEIETRASDVLTSRGVTGHTFSSVPADLTTAATGTDIEVTVSASAGANSIFNVAAFSTTEVESTVVMQKQ